MLLLVLVFLVMGVFGVYKYREQSGAPNGVRRSLT
jgi:hypothetical protein